MSGTLEDALAPYAYAFPQALIAREPATPRDAARLLISDPHRNVECIDTVRRIADYLPKNALLVLNDTKVIPARIEARRPTGGRVEVLLTRFHGTPLRAMLSRRVPVGEVLATAGGKAFRVAGQEGREWLLLPLFPRRQLSALLRRHGHAPLPPYIKRPALTEAQARAKYQSVFAAHSGSIAAPTASLHFTRRLMAELRRRGIVFCTVTLHVHLGTFLPLTEKNLRDGRLHVEEYSIPKKTISALKKAEKNDQKIVAVGTTALRALESACDARGAVVRPAGSTDLFIREGYAFKAVDGLLTNFHVPKSSLLMLVCAFAGRQRTMRLYRKAVRERMRLFSFGDAMLLFR